MFTRRRVTAALGVAGVSLLGGTFLLARREFSVSYPTPSEAHTVATVAEFIGTLFGHVLTNEDRDELTGRLLAAIEYEPQNRLRYTVLTQYCDQYARELGAAGFVAAKVGVRSSVVNRFMSIRPDSLGPRLLIHLSGSARSYYDIRWRTIPAVAMLYRRSGLPWRVRGYRRWPGVPGSWAEILQPGPAYPDVRVAGGTHG